jgi:hypothetical protein
MMLCLHGAPTGAVREARTEPVRGARRACLAAVHAIHQAAG